MSTMEAKFGFRGTYLTADEIKKDFNGDFNNALKTTINSFKDRNKKKYKELEFKFPEDEYYNRYEKDKIFIVTDGENICIDIILDYGYESIDDFNMYLSLKDINMYSDILSLSLNCNKKSIKVFAYSWYNSCEEPINI